MFSPHQRKNFIQSYSEWCTKATQKEHEALILHLDNVTSDENIAEIVQIIIHQHLYYYLKTYVFKHTDHLQENYWKCAKWLLIFEKTVTSTAIYNFLNEFMQIFYKPQKDLCVLQ